MKKIYILIITLLISITVNAKEHHKVDIRNTVIEKEGEKITVSFEIIPGDFPSNYSSILTPILYNGDGEWKALEPVILVGKKRNLYDKRTFNTEGDRRIISKKTYVEQYTTTIDYEGWMQYISVSVEQINEGCCSQFEFPLEQVIENQLLFYKITPYFDVKPFAYELTELEKYDLNNPFLHPMEDYDKRYDILMKDRDKGSSVVIFTVGSHRLDMDFQGNKDVLESIAKALELIDADPNAVLKHIMVAGYASPEGGLAFNTALAERRAQSVKAFIQTLLVGKSDHLFEMYNGREDWGGLREKVENSFMAERDGVLNIIDSYTMEQEERKTKLKQYAGGQPYKYMLENFYPPLRSAGYVQVYYEIDRTATVATAVTDEFGRTTWVDPDSPRNRGVTALNKSLEYLVDNKFDQALETLDEYKQDPRSWNIIGVCYMMKGDFDSADRYFKRAADNGDENAAKNMEQTMWARKVKMTK